MTTRARRPKGEGGIYFDEAADRWVGQFDAGRTDSGKRRRVKVTGKTRAEVADKMKARRRALDDGHQAPVTMTVADLLDEWVASVLPTMTTNTAAQYRWAVALLREGLGSHRLGDLRAHHVERFLRTQASRKADDGQTAALNRTSVSRLRSALGRVLRWGQRRDLVARNVAELAELPAARPPSEGRSLTADELGRVLDAARGTRLEAVWTVLSGAGLRPGEALGLSWSDVDLDAGLVHVRRALKWSNGTPLLGDLKTARARRSLGVPPQVVAALRAHRARQLEERLALRWPAEWGDLVFLTNDGTPVDASNLRRELATLAKAADVGHLRPYDLRHTCASLLADAGVPLERIADFLGHDGIRMARTIYVHALSPTVDVGVAPLGAALGSR